MRVVQVSFHRDRLERDPDALLEAWPTLPRVASAVAATGTSVAVVQPAARDARFHRHGVDYRFVAEARGRRRGPAGTRPVTAAAPRIAAAVQALEPDVIHVQGLSLPGHARRLTAALPGVPLLAQDHADAPPPPWRRPAARRDARAWDAVAFTAREQARPFLAAGVLRPAVPVFEVLESSTDFRPGDRARARRATGVHGSPALLWVGRLDPNKDPMTVLDGMAAAAPHLRDPQLWCCFRGGPLLSAVRARITAHPVLAGRVHLLGERPPDQVEALMQAADALVQGSHAEGSGYAVLEALACGAVPVVTDIPSLRRIAGADLAHLLWRPGDAASCARALLRMAGHPGDALRYRARRRFEEGLTWGAVGSELRAAYEGCRTAGTLAP